MIVKDADTRYNKQQDFTSQINVPSAYSCEKVTCCFCRYENIQRTMATEEDGESPRLERSSSAETDSETSQTGTVLTLLII